MVLFIINEIGFSVHLIAEYDREEERVTVTFFREKPQPRGGMVHMDHLLTGQAINLGEDWSEDTRLKADLSPLDVSAKIDVETGAHGLILRLKLKNGSHVVGQRGYAGYDPDEDPGA